MGKIRIFSIALGVISLLALSGCGSSTKKMDINSSLSDLADANNYDFDINDDSDSGKLGALKTIHFGFNNSSIPSDDKQMLDLGAEFLKANSTLKIQVEGHCDERGGVQYNLALGEKRAQSVRDYLINLGVNSDQITTISFGKERPIAFGHDDGSWGQNRRANFVVIAK